MGDLLGQRLGKFRVERMLGGGAMSTVYAARDEELLREVAIKVFKTSGSAEPGETRQFLAEARVLARLQHPNILAVYEAGLQGDSVFLVMPLVEGGTLADRIRAGPLPLPDAARIARDLGRAIDYAHKAGVIHRDIKPSNVLLDSDGAPQLADWGVAGAFGPAPTADRVVVGTLGYMAPEALMGEAIDQRADLYSLAAVIFEMLAGAPPFPVTDMREALAARRGAAPSVRANRPELPPDLDTALRRALAFDPDHRFSTADEFLAALLGGGRFEAGGEAARPSAHAFNARRPAVPAPGTGDSGRSDRDGGAHVDRGPRAGRRPRVWLAALLAAGLLAAASVFVLTQRNAPLSPDVNAEAPRHGGAPGQRDAPLSRSPTPEVPGNYVAPASAQGGARKRPSGNGGLTAGLQDRMASARGDVVVRSDPAWLKLAVLLGLATVAAAIPVNSWRRQRSRVAAAAAAGPALQADSVGGPGLALPSDRTMMMRIPHPPTVAPAEVHAADQTMFLTVAKPAATLPQAPTAAIAVTQSADTSMIGARIPIERFPFRIGRGDQVELSIPGDRALSREHVVLDFHAGLFELRDAGSTNGAYLNGRLVAPGGQARLLFNDVIRLSADTAVTFVSAGLVKLPDLTGQIVASQYRLAELLHASEKSALYAADDLTLPRRVAIKLFSPALAGFPDYRAQFEKEAQVSARLHHPHICRILGTGQATFDLHGGDTLRSDFLCLELMAGGNLARRLEREPKIPTATLVRWAQALADALDHAHGRDVVHAAIKPTAVVFDQEGHPYLSDFALSSRLGEGSAGVILGSPAFLAPEQWLGQVPTAYTDQYALAAVLFLALTGRRPFAGQEDPEVRANNFRMGPPAAGEVARRAGRDDVPARVSEVFARALATAPEQRYPRAGDFAQALSAAFEARGRGARQVFLSYHRTSSAGWATLIARELRDKHRIDAYMDTQGIDAAGRFPDRLREAIEGCGIFVCLLAGDTLESDWVREEIRIASACGRPMVPVFQESFETGRALAAGNPAVAELLRYDGVHLFDRRNVHIDHSLADLARIIASTVPP